MSPIIPKQELKIDKTLFRSFICKDIMSFWNEIDVYNVDDGIVDLFSILDNKISQYLQIWDRSTLVTVIIFYDFTCCLKKIKIYILKSKIMHQ